MKAAPKNSFLKLSQKGRGFLEYSSGRALFSFILVLRMPETPQFLRHAVATLRYRADKVLRDAPPGFATAQLAPGIRTPIEILAHLGDLFDWALRLAGGSSKWTEAAPLPWLQEVDRFHQTLDLFDARLNSPEPLAAPVEQLFQGPVADALTHIGQLALLRRMAGNPIRPENYFKAAVTIKAL